MKYSKNMYYPKTPNKISQLIRCLKKSISTKEVLNIPNITAEQENVRIDCDRINNYRRVCQFKNSNNQIPATYPHIIAFPLHLELLLHPCFPTTPIGLVHLSNIIEQYRPMTANETLTIRVQFGKSIETHRGVEFDIETQIYSQHELVWTSSSTNLIRSESRKNKIQKNSNLLITDNICMANNVMTETIDMPANWGIQYGLISGDLNPIHLYPWSAKLLGFRRNIAHGMASAAVIFSLLNNQRCLERFKFITKFGKPIFLPNQTKLYHAKDQGSDNTYFELYSSNDKKVNSEKERNISGVLSAI